MCKRNPGLRDGTLAIAVDRSPASNYALARPDSITFEYMSFAKFAEADVGTNGDIQPEMAIASLIPPLAYS